MNKRDKAIELLTQNGFKDKHDQLAAEGFDFPWKNLAFLKKFNGDVEKVKQQYEKREERSKSPQETKKEIQVLLDAKFKDQNQKLVDAGYNFPRRNLKLLVKFDGDVQKVLEKYQEKKNKHEKGGKFEQKEQTQVQSQDAPKQTEKERKKHCHGKFKGGKEQAIQKLNELNWLEKHEALKQEGYDFPRRNLKLLQKFDGNVEQVIDKYLKKTDRQKSLEIANNRIQAQGFDAQNQQLNEMGFKQNWKNLRALRQTQGDVQKAIEILTEKKDHFGLKEKKQALFAKLERMQKEGFEKKGKNLMFLAMFDGDVEKVIQVMKERKEKEEKHQQRKQQKQICDAEKQSQNQQ